MEAGATPRAKRLSGLAIAGIVAAVILVLVAVLGLGEMRLRTCVERANAQYPAVPVSAFNGRATGPLKVSYVRERARAVADCGRF
jgi:hypothetical protein